MAASRPLLSNVIIPTPVLKERRALLQRVLWSHQIEKSGRIRDFLLYVCERALQEPSVEIHEQEIGYRVFGRNENYDTSADNIVRVTASQARKKLDQYFASEGASEPTILEIPKGKYTPAFIERGPAVAEIATQPEHRPHLSMYRRAVFMLAACVLMLGTLAVWQGVRLRATRLAASSVLNSNPALESLWSQLLPSTGRTDIVVADSSLSLFEELLDHQLTLSEYLKPNQWLTSGELSSNPELKAFAQLAAQRGFTSMASVTTAYRISQLVGRDQGRISILRARDFNMPQMKFDNVILLGSTRANPWEELIQGRLNFRYGFDQKSRYSYFENLTPHPGELKIYRDGLDGQLLSACICSESCGNRQHPLDLGDRN